MKKIFYHIVFLAWLCINLSGCTIDNPTKSFQTTSYVEIAATSIQELYDKSEAVITGRSVELGGVINMARDVYDPSMPDAGLFIIGQVYQVEVNEYIKGSGPDMIHVVQMEGLVNNPSRLNVDELIKAKKPESYTPVVLERDYLMFLIPMLGGPDDTYFSGTSLPWRFNIEDRNKIKPETTWKEADRYFPVRSFSEMLLLFDTPVMAPGTSYPPPPTPYP